MKQAILTGEMGFTEAVQAAVDYHTEINKAVVAPAPAVPGTEQDPYCYPGTDVLINKLGIRDKQALQTAETEISPLRLAQLSFTMPVAYPAPS